MTSFRGWKPLPREFDVNLMTSGWFLLKLALKPPPAQEEISNFRFYITWDFKEIKALKHPEINCIEGRPAGRIWKTLMLQH